MKVRRKSEKDGTDVVYEYEYDYKHLMIDSETHQTIKQLSKETGTKMSQLVRNAFVTKDENTDHRTLLRDRYRG